MADRDWKTYYAAWDPENTDRALLAAYMAASASTAENPAAERELTSILKKHGVQDVPEERNALQKLFAPVQDRPAFYTEVMNLAARELKAKGTPLKGLEGAIQNVSIQGDRATATNERPDGTTRGLSFIRRNGTWFLGGP